MTPLDPTLRKKLEASIISARREAEKAARLADKVDALGTPIGRVLKSQATEVRARRRAWAREKAAKLPIKIMFPLVLFIFPPIMALVLGPAVLSFGKLGAG